MRNLSGGFEMSCVMGPWVVSHNKFEDRTNNKKARLIDGMTKQ